MACECVSMNSYVLKYGDIKKFVRVDDKHSLVLRILELFNLQEFNMYVMVDSEKVEVDIQDLPDSGLLLVERSQDPEIIFHDVQHAVETCTNAQDVDEEDGVEMPAAVAGAERPSTSRSTSVRDGDEEERVEAPAPLVGAGRLSTPRAAIGDVGEGCIDAGRLRPSTRDKLETNPDDLTQDDWSHLCGAVFEQYREKHGHSCPDRYEPIAAEIIKCYPGICSNLMEYQRLVFVAQKLRFRFRNLRKRSSSPDVVNFRKAYHEKRRATVTESVKALTGFMPRVLHEASHDEAMTNRVISGERGEELMQETFPRRRQDILGSRGKKGMSIARIVKTYPALFEAAEFWREFERIAGRPKDTQRALFLEKLMKWLKEVERRCCSEPENTMNSLLRVLEEENAVINEDLAAYPHLSEENGWAVTVEKQGILHTASLEDAVGLWCVAHYVLHQKTSRAVRNTNWFIRTKIINVPCEMDPDRAVVKDVEQWEV